MTLTPEVRDQIASSQLFVCLVPRGGLFGEGSEQLEYAASLGKHVIYWVPEGRPDPPERKRIPGPLVRTAEDVSEAATEYLELAPDDEVEIVDGEY